MVRPFRSACLHLTMLAVMAACTSQPEDALPGNMQDTRPFAGIGEDEELHLIGTEPFWGGTVADGIFSYSTIEDQDGTRVAVTRFAGRGGLSFSGNADGIAVDLALTPAECSDGMSERSYPYAATLQWDGEQRFGCAWSDRHPFTEGANAP